jgi:sugar/nucleoside kinase (ribokinase family)
MSSTCSAGQTGGKPDAAGQFALDTMGRYVVDTGGLRVKPDVPASATMLPIRSNGERPALHVLGANAELSAEDVDLAAIGRAKVLHFGGSPLMPKLDVEPALGVPKAAKATGRTCRRRSCRSCPTSTTPRRVWTRLA